QRARGIRTEAVANHALEQDSLAVEVQPVARAHFEGTEAETLLGAMDYAVALKQGDGQAVEVGRFRAPELRVRDPCRQPHAAGAAAGNRRGEWRPDRAAAGVG